LTKEQRKYNGEKIVFSTNGAGTIGHPHAKMNLDRLYNPHKNLLERDHRSKCKMQN